MIPEARAAYHVTGLADRPRMAAAASKAATPRALPAINVTAKPPAGSGRAAGCPRVRDGIGIGEVLLQSFNVSVSMDQDRDGGAKQFEIAGSCRRDHQRLRRNFSRGDVASKRGERLDAIYQWQPGARVDEVVDHPLADGPAPAIGAGSRHPDAAGAANIGHQHLGLWMKWVLDANPPGIAVGWDTPD